MTKANKHTGSSLDEFLAEEGILEQTRNVAILEVVSWQIKEYMRNQGVTKIAMAKKLETSRSQLDRLLDPDSNANVTIGTLAKAAQVLGKDLRVELV